jgi:hypothetical protein
MKVYQPRTNLINCQNGDLLAYSQNILNSCQPLNAHGINEIVVVVVVIIIIIIIIYYYYCSFAPHGA